jgi:Flp pilus assembly protein TadD
VRLETFIVAVVMALTVPGAVYAAVEAPPPLAASRTPVAVVQEKQHHMRGKTVGEEPSGIALPADSLSVPPIDDAVTAEIAKKIKDTPVLASKRKKHTVRPKARASIKVTKEPPVSSFLRAAYQDIEAQDFPAAVELYNKALEKDGNDDAAWTGKTFALQQIGTPEAKDELKKMIEQKPFSATAHAALAQTLTMNGEREQALASWQKAVELDPGNNTYRLSLAILHDRMGHDTEALALYKQLKPPVPYAVKRRMEYLTAQTKPAATP